MSGSSAGSRARRALPSGMRYESINHLIISKLAWNLWQHFHASNAGSDPKASALAAVFYPHHRRPAADPLLLALGYFRRQNQNHFELAAFADLGVGIEKDSTFA